MLCADVSRCRLHGNPTSSVNIPLKVSLHMCGLSQRDPQLSEMNMLPFLSHGPRRQ